MLKVGLTGGIACGKSFARKEFQKLGVHGIDSDRIGHEVIGKDGSAFQAVVEEFGASILDASGGIDRRKLGVLVFGDDALRLRLNQLVHPFIFEREDQVFNSLQNPLSNLRPGIAMTDAALMVETGSYRRYDFVVVIFCLPEIQLRRLHARDGIAEAAAQLRIRSQMPVLEKLRYADFVIDNSGKMSNTIEQIHQVHNELVHCYAA